MITGSVYRVGVIAFCHDILPLRPVLGRANADMSATSLSGTSVPTTGAHADRGDYNTLIRLRPGRQRRGF